MCITKGKTYATKELALKRQHSLWKEHGVVSGVYCLTDAKGKTRYALLFDPDNYELDNRVLA